jgi:hypothetical protein
MQVTKAFPSLLIVVLGTLDCVTTVIGILYFGAVEQNPFMANVASASLGAFTLVKMATTLVIGAIFYQTDKILLRTTDQNSRMFVWARRFLKVSWIGVLVFLAVVVSNNLLVLMNSL